jgi:hypothetical protein
MCRRHCNLITCFQCDLPNGGEDEWICHVIVITSYVLFFLFSLFFVYYRLGWQATAYVHLFDVYVMFGGIHFIVPAIRDDRVLPQTDPTFGVIPTLICTDEGIHR